MTSDTSTPPFTADHDAQALARVYARADSTSEVSALKEEWEHWKMLAEPFIGIIITAENVLRLWRSERVTVIASDGSEWEVARGATWQIFRDYGGHIGMRQGYCLVPDIDTGWWWLSDGDDRHEYHPPRFSDWSDIAGPMARMLMLRSNVDAFLGEAYKCDFGDSMEGADDEDDEEVEDEEEVEDDVSDVDPRAVRANRAIGLAEPL